MKIIDIKPKTDPELIKSLEKLLREAKTGEVRGLAYVVNFDTGDTANGWVNVDNNVMAIIGEVETLKYELMNNYVEMRNSTDGDIA